MTDQKPKTPLWIDRLLLFAALTACLAAVLAAWLGRQKGLPPERGTIADMTVNLSGTPVREHCLTCHLGGGRARQGDSPAVGRAHPDIAPHLPERLGCTGCHLGEGMALDERISHGVPGLGARQVLKGKEVQARCYACHELAPLPGAQKAWQGYELFLGRACGTCHTVTGLEKGGRYGPDLSDVGSYLGLEQIREAIREPRKAPENSIMPRFPLSGSQIRDLGYFLKSRVANPNYATPMEIQAGLISLPSLEPPRREKSMPPGRRLLHVRRCLACHKFREEDGRIAPDLTYIGQMRQVDYLRGFLTNPVRFIPGAVMPRIPMTAAEEESLLSFLAGEAIGPIETPAGHGEEGHGNTAGKRLYMALCQRCHAANGDGHGPIQPNLANFPRAFAGNAAFFRRIPDRRIESSLAKGVPGTSMPPYGTLLDAASRDALLDLVFRVFIGIGRNDKADLRPLPPRPAPGLREAERAGSLYRSHCVRCHGIAGTGKGPEYLEHLPRPRNLANTPFFAALDDERIARAIYDGIPGTAMPAFGDQLNGQDLWALVDRVRALSGTGKKP